MGNIPTQGVILIPRKEGAVLMQLHNVYIFNDIAPEQKYVAKDNSVLLKMSIYAQDSNPVVLLVA